MVTGSGDLDAWASALDSAFVLRPGDPTPLNSLVTQRQTLGLDRVANAWAVLHGGLMDAPHHETWMIVDVGTCVTMDVVHRDQHLGGIISPGVQMRLQAMAQGTARLPQPDLTDQLPHPLSASASLGTHTQGALLRGALGGIVRRNRRDLGVLVPRIPKLGGRTDRRRRPALGTPRHPPEIRRRSFDPEGFSCFVQTPPCLTSSPPP